MRSLRHLRPCGAFVAPVFAFFWKLGVVMLLLRVTPTWGELTKSTRNLLLEDISQTLVWGKQSVRLSATASANPEGRTGRKPGTHFDKTEEG